MDRLWTRSFVLMSLGSFFLFTSFYLLLPTMPLFIKELGGLDAQVGLAAGVFTFAAVIVRPFAGGLLDQYGRRPFLLVGLVLFAVSMYVYGWVNGVGALLFAVTIDVNPGIFFLVYAFALTLVRPLAGTLSDRHGEATVIVPATALTIIALAILSTATGPGGVITAAVLYGIGFGSAQPALQAAILSMVPRERFGIANASFFTAFDLGIAFGSTLLGWVSQWLGYRALFTTGSVSVAISLTVFVAFVRPLLRRRDEVVA